ncbi:MAG: hypothetical protein HC905_14070 [Bacteroidales bacterium]|nr:hypothetical protein [Bacteroidales bacterium]
MGQKSSNGKVLFQACLQQNKKSYFVSEPEMLKTDWFTNAKSTGICGATSTPVWQMENIRNEIIHLLAEKKGPNELTKHILSLN